MAKKDYDLLFKLVVVGDTGVGKSSLLLRFVDNTYSNTLISSIGVDFKFKSLKIDKKTIKLQIWDTAGQERYQTISNAYYRGADGIIIIYDITSEDSFKHIVHWLEEVNRYASENSVKILIGNKSDIVNRTITIDRANELAERLKLPYIETSAKDSVNINEAFNIITNALVKQKNNSASQSIASIDDRKSVTLSSTSTSSNVSKKSCC